MGLAPRATAAAWGFLGACFVIGMFGQLLDLPGWIQDISPFQHVPSYPAADLHALPLAVLVVIAAGLAALGLDSFRRRDLG
jgi:ABC-2 type transport system permease protein